ncbi:hypothetical protein BSKO_08515 [Bryopsis sp. KO-2023]|nr:hypothetical protein BSKO_08515 [Bryopsis sp. KO-2023]
MRTPSQKFLVVSDWEGGARAKTVVLAFFSLWCVRKAVLPELWCSFDRCAKTDNCRRECAKSRTCLCISRLRFSMEDTCCRQEPHPKGVPALSILTTQADERVPFDGWSKLQAGIDKATIQMSHALKGVIDDASYGWNPLLEDQVHWCVWSAPQDLHVAYLLNILANTLMSWGMYSEAKVAYHKALSIGLEVAGPDHPDTISTMVSLSGAVWKEGRLEEGLVLLQSAGESFARCNDGGLSCMATRCLLKVAAAYDALGWHKQAESVWDRVTDLI